MNGVERIAAERQRQIEVEGWSLDHDDEHYRDELSWAAICYAAPQPVFMGGFNEAGGGTFFDPWPWEPDWDKRPRKLGDEEMGIDGRLLPKREQTPEQRIRCLEKAGALIAAEIDRLLRDPDFVSKGPLSDTEKTDVT